MLMILLAEKLKDHESYYSSYRGDMIVCTKCHCNSSNSSQDFFFTQKNKCQSHEEIQGKIFKIHALGTMNVCTQFHGNPTYMQLLKNFSLDQSDGPTNLPTLPSIEPRLQHGYKRKLHLNFLTEWVKIISDTHIAKITINNS